MKILVFFDAYASAYDIKDQIGTVGNIDGVISSTLLRNAGGDDAAGYCVLLDADDAKAPEIMGQLKSFAAQFSGYYSNLKVTAFGPA